MGASTKIEWTDHTFNPWRSCQHLILADGTVHPACEHCYAETMAKRFPERLGKWGADGTRIMAPEKLWRQPLAWNKAAGIRFQESGVRTRVFCASIADVFEDWQGEIWDERSERVFDIPTGRYWTMDDLRKKLFAMIDQTPWLDWQLLTKRPGNIRAMWPLELIPGTSGLWGQQKRRNVWLGTSISNQQTADELIPQLLQARELVPVLFLSAEPLLGPIDLSWSIPKSDFRAIRDLFNWLICGGESGQQARPCHPDWARSLRDQCQAAGVPFFFKQWGEWQNGSHINGKLACVLNDGRYAYPDGQEARQKLNRETAYDWGRFAATSMAKVGKAEAGRLLDGREWNEFPEQAHTEAPRHREEEPV